MILRENKSSPVNAASVYTDIGCDGKGRLFRQTDVIIGYTFCLRYYTHSTYIEVFLGCQFVQNDAHKLTMRLAHLSRD